MSRQPKTNWSPEQEEENPYESLPQLNLFTYQMSQMIGEELEKGLNLMERISTMLLT